MKNLRKIRTRSTKRLVRSLNPCEITNQSKKKRRRKQPNAVTTPTQNSSSAFGNNRRSAVISSCGTWRYSLHVTWDSTQPSITFIGLNPSTTNWNPTIRRCAGFAKDWGYGSLILVNLFAFRATDPSDLWAASATAPAPAPPLTAEKQKQQPITTTAAASGALLAVGPKNDESIEASAAASKLVIAAWGAFPKAIERAHEVCNRLERLLEDQKKEPLHVIRLTQAGHPGHPLYLPRSLKPIRWDQEAKKKKTRKTKEKKTKEKRKTKK